MSAEQLGVFAKFADYGVLGLAVIALGYVGWFFFKKNMEEKDRLQKMMEEKLNLHLIEHPQWKFINVRNEMNSEYGQFIGEILLTTDGEINLYRLD